MDSKKLHIYYKNMRVVVSQGYRFKVCSDQQLFVITRIGTYDTEILFEESGREMKIDTEDLVSYLENFCEPLYN